MNINWLHASIHFMVFVTIGIFLALLVTAAHASLVVAAVLAVLAPVLLNRPLNIMFPLFKDDV